MGLPGIWMEAARRSLFFGVALMSWLRVSRWVLFSFL